MIKTTQFKTFVAGHAVVMTLPC